MILYFYDLMYPRKVCAAASYLRVGARLKLVDVSKDQHKSADFMAINPNGLLPVLVDGSRVIWESNAILCYLAGKFDPTFWPTDSRHVELVRWLSWDASSFSNAAGTLYFELYVRKRFSLGFPDAGAVAKAQRQFRECATILDAHLCNSDWVVGEGPTAADFALGAALPYAANIDLPVPDYSAIQRWYNRLSALRGWADPFGDAKLL